MKFRAEHGVRGVSLAEFENIFFDESFNIALCHELKLERHLERREIKNGHLSRVTRVAPDRELPRPVAKVLGHSKLEYTEHMEYQFGSGHGTWRIISKLMTDKVDSSGTFSFSQQPGEVTVRLVEGDVKVRVFGLGALVERFIAADVERSYEDAARFTQRWVDAGRHKTSS